MGASSTRALCRKRAGCGLWRPSGTAIQRQGRLCELYTDRGSHFCHTPKAGGPSTAEHDGQVSRALKVLGSRPILARSPQGARAQ